MISTKGSVRRTLAGSTQVYWAQPTITVLFSLAVFVTSEDVDPIFSGQVIDTEHMHGSERALALDAI